MSDKRKKTTDSINAKLALVIKSGKYHLGYRSVLRKLRDGKGLVIIISDNCPPMQKSEIEYYAMLSKTSVFHFAGNNNALGTACGKLYGVSTMVITDAGDSDIENMIG